MEFLFIYLLSQLSFNRHTLKDAITFYDWLWKEESNERFDHAVIVSESDLPLDTFNETYRRIASSEGAYVWYRNVGEP
jgi:hypothetical protein